MDWTMIGALGEILGAAGVIITLAYLATQVRQNTHASRQEALRETLELNTRFLSQVASNPQVATLYRRGMVSDPSLTDDEVIQCRALFMQLLGNYQRIFQFERDAGFPEGTFAASNQARKDILRAPGLQSFFRLYSNWFDEDFREVLEREITPGGPWRIRGLGAAAPLTEE